MRAGEAYKFANVGPGDYGPFALYGGIYQITVQGLVSGSVTLYELGPNGTTYLSASDAFVANGGDTIYLPPGQYKFTAITDPNLYFQIVAVPVS